MDLAVIGGTGGIGAEVVRQALSRGHRVRAFGRSAGSMSPQEGLTPLAGDATKAEDLASLVTGADAVAMCLGIPKSLSALARPTTLFSDATEALLPVMAEAGVRRLLAVTGFGAGESRAAVGRILDLPFQAVMGRAYADKTRQETLIEESDLDWTIARPGILTNGAMSKRYKVLVAPDAWRMGVISRADVAHFLVTAAEEGSHIHAAPVLIR